MGKTWMKIKKRLLWRKNNFLEHNKPFYIFIRPLNKWVKRR